MVAPAELAAVPLFSSLTEEELEELAPLFEERAVSEDVELAGEGAAGYLFFVLADGGAVATAADGLLARFEPGDFFGEAALLGDGRRDATVTTTAPSKLL